ncbi:hypothetical protein EUX98_g1405 [Antrodiella citrinella]|uniref:Major facilitator superfamily (MFS) profile domain-containing protein n=1 Tax=Antrodiella citrinella TaxID=2447956 RepID=A0A4V3XJE9_9APHY|nr:hypothetical protein EUX98_g1405 [Antrodiella citrinella]
MSTTQTEVQLRMSPVHASISLKANSSDSRAPVGDIITHLPKVHTLKSSDIEAFELAELRSESQLTTTNLAPALTGTVFPAATAKMRRKANIQFATLCWTLFLGGWTSGTTGPLLPRIQAVYHVGFALVSLLFVFNCLGSIVASVVNIYLSDKVGFGWVVVIGAAVQVVGYSVSVPAPPFWVLVLSYFVTGFGVALQDASASAYIASLRVNSPTRMGIMHSVYGFGAFCAPLAATQFAQLDRWSFFFLVSLGITIPNIITLAAVFKFKRQHELLTEIGQPPIEESATDTKNTANVYRDMMKQKPLHILTAFMFVYLGVGIAIGGWIVTYLTDTRGGGSSTGYVSSGLYGGITVGRLALIWVNKKLIVWFVPSLIGDAVAVSFAGVFLGPLYPIVMNQAARILPPRLLTGCVSWIGGFGQAGSAFMPFVTGALAASRGIESIQPLCVPESGLKH